MQLPVSGLVQREGLAAGARAELGLAPRAVELGVLLADGEARRLEEQAPGQQPPGLGDLPLIGSWGARD